MSANDLISIVCVLLGNYSILVLFTEFKYSKKTICLILTLVYAYCLIAAIGGALLFGSTFMKLYCMPMTAIPSVVVLYFLSKDSFSKWLFSIFTEFNVFYVIMAVAYYITIKWSISESVAYTIVRAAPYVLFCILFYFFGRRAYRSVVNSIESGWWILDLMAFGFTLLLNYLVVGKIMVLRAGKEDYCLTFIAVLVCIFVYIGVFKLFGYMLRESRYKAEAQYYHMQEKLLNAELNAQEEKVEIAKQTRHDLRHHNAIVMELLQNGQAQEAMDYLNEYQSKLTDQSGQKGVRTKSWTTRRALNFVYTPEGSSLQASI